MTNLPARPPACGHGDKVISVAPMMDWTDRHCRYFHRLLAPSVLLYTEMVTTGALIFGKDKERFLGFDDSEHPVALQLGGSDPKDLAVSAKMGEDFGYDEINLNCGCPSDAVQKGAFGACLMKDPVLVRDCVAAMRGAVSIPVTVKCRIGIDDSEEYTFLEDFVGTISDGGNCDTFIIHARKAWLKGLSPKENRDIPPLQYDVVAKLKSNFPHLFIHVNGGIKTIEQIHSFLDCLPRESGDLHRGERFLLSQEKQEFNVVDAPPNCHPERQRRISLSEGDSSASPQNDKTGFDGIMIGREAYQNPWFLRQIEEEFYGTKNLPSAEEVVLKMIPYIKDQQTRYGTPVKSVTRHMTGLFQGMPGARHWRQILSTEIHQDGVQAEILETALNKAFRA